MTILRISLLVAAAVVAMVMVKELVISFISRIIDIYFETKLRYTSKVIGGLGKVLADTAEQMGGNKKD